MPKGLTARPRGRVPHVAFGVLVDADTKGDPIVLSFLEFARAALKLGRGGSGGGRDDADGENGGQGPA